MVMGLSRWIYGKKTALDFDKLKEYRNMNYLALVFDDGPHDPICEMADKIKCFGWSAGFAVIGQYIKEETLPMLRYVIDNGFQIVSHGQEHLHMEKIPTREEIEKEIYLPIKTVKEKLNYEMTMTRLPYLSENSRALIERSSIVSPQELRFPQRVLCSASVPLRNLFRQSDLTSRGSRPPHQPGVGEALLIC